jgi:hypothetical protein
MTRLKTVDTVKTLTAWLQKAKPGEQASYHVGVLMRDRIGLDIRMARKHKIEGKALAFVNRHATELDAVATMLSELEEDGKVFLSQLPVTDIGKVYVVTKPSKKKPTHHPRVPIKFGSAAVASGWGA